MLLTLPLDLFFIVVFVLSACGAGEKILKRIPGLNLTGLEVFYFSMGLGFFIFSYTVFLMGYLGVLYRGVFWLLVLSILIFSWKNLYLALRKHIGIYCNKFSGISLFEKILFLYFGVLVVFNILYAYCPPTGDDEIVTHLSMPLHWIGKHKIYNFPGMDAQHIQFGISSLFTFLMTLTTPLTVRLFNFIQGVLCAGAVFMLSKDIIGRKTSVLAAVIFYSMPMVATLSGSTYSDFGVLLYGLLGVHAFCRWYNDASNQSMLVLAAIFAAAEIAGKFTGFPITLIIAMMTIFRLRANPFKALKKSLIIVSVISVLFLPYLIRNYLLKGNPVYPTKIFNLNYGEFMMDWMYFSKISAKGFFSQIFNSYKSSVIWSSGPLFFIFLPVLIFIKKKPAKLTLITVIAVINYMLIYLSGINRQLNRFNIISFALLACVIAYVIVYLHTELKIKKTVVLLILPFIAMQLPISAYLGLKRIPVFTGFQTKEEYFNNEYTIREGAFFVEYINKNVAPGKGIYFLGLPLPTGFNYPKNRNYGMDAFSSEFYQYSTEKAMRELRKNDIDYILYFKNSFNETDNGVVMKLKKPLLVRWFNKSVLVPVISHNNITLYRI